MQEIKPLPRSVHGPLRSSVVLFDLARVVEELVNNSLDASATKVFVSIGVTANYVKVEDDGCGITRDELVLLGEKYATSKSGLMNDMKANTPSLGFRGEALSSLSDISIVEVRTKARGKPNAYCKIIKGSRCLFLGIDDQKEDPGTTVIVRDLFYNQPVRRRCMQSSPKKMLHSVKKCVLRTALVHPQVSFRVTIIESEDELLCTVPSLSPLPLVSDMFGNEVSSSLHEIHFSDQMLMLSGYLSRPENAFSTKAFQYLYINSRFVSKGPIHNLLNNLTRSFQCSLAHQRVPEFQSGKRQKIQVYPAFMFNLCCPLSLYDLNFEPSKTLLEFKDWDAILTFFEQAARNAWKLPPSQSFEDNSFADESGLPGKAKVQKHDVERSIYIRKNRCISPINEQVSTKIPQDFAVEDICTSQIHEKLRRFSQAIESRGSKTDNFGGKYSSFQYVTNDTEHVLATKFDAINCSNSITYCNDAGSLLEKFVTPDLTPQVGERYCMSGSGWKSEEGVGTLGKISGPSVISGHQDIPIRSQECLFGVLSKSVKECYPLLKNEHCNSDYQSGYDDCFFKRFHSRKDSPFLDITGAKNTNSKIDSWNFKDILCEETIDVSRPSFNVFRKCQTKKTVDVLSTDEINECSFSPNFVPNEDVEDWKTGSRAGSSETEWSFPSPRVWHDKSFKKTCHPAKERTSERNFTSSKNVGSWANCVTVDKDEYLSPTRSRFSAVLPRINCVATKLDCYDFKSFEGEMRSKYPSDEITSEDLCFSDKLNDELKWLHSDTWNAIDMHHDFKSKWQPVQNDDLTFGSSWNKLGFRRHRPPFISKARSERSQSAPPLYKGKRKFLLCDRLVAEERKKPYSHSAKMPETARPPSAMSVSFSSQSCRQSILAEDSQPHSRNPNHEKPNILEVMHSCGSEANKLADYSASERSKWRPGVCQLMDGESSCKPVEHVDDILNISSGLLHLSGASLVPESIDKACLRDARVLLQVDRKFIPVIASGMLIIIDQHAADERIRLEELRRKVLSGEGIRISYLNSEQKLILPEMGFQLLQKYAEKIQKWGWIFYIHGQLMESLKKKNNILKRHVSDVTLLAVPCVLDINLTDKDLIEFIEQLVETDGSSNIPPSVLRILNFKACRGAIMFGDSLLPSECSLIVEELKATLLCFQCAHGRPTTVPLVNMASLHEQLSKLNVQKGGSKGTWHGLYHHKSSIRRAQMRLDSAKRFHNG